MQASVLDVVASHGFDVADALDRLFTRAAPAAGATPSRAAAAVEWQTLGALASGFVAYATDTDPADIARPWEDKIFEEVRSQLAGGQSTSSVNYDKSIPVLRIYREYAYVIEELAVSPHPLSLLLGAGKNAFSPNEQAAVKESVKRMFTAAAKFRELQKEYFEQRLAADYADYDEAETAYRRLLEQASPIDGDSLLELQQCAQTLQAEYTERQHMLNDLKSQHYTLVQTGRDIERQLEPELSKLARIREDKACLDRELDRRRTRAFIPDETIERAKKTLMMYTETDAKQKAEINELQKECENLNAQLGGLQEALEDGLLPIQKLVNTKLMNELQLHKSAVQGASIAEADQTSEQATQASVEQHQRQEQIEVERIAADVNEEVNNLKDRISAANRTLQSMESSAYQATQRARAARIQELQQQTADCFRAQREQRKEFERIRKELENMSSMTRAVRDNIIAETREYPERNAKELSKAIENIAHSLQALSA